MASENPDKETNQETSFRGRNWDIATPGAKGTSEIRSEGANALVARILSSRGMDGEAFRGYRDPLIKDLMPDPFRLQDMEVGAKRIARAIREGQRIGVWSDYDVDGACSGALFIEILRACGHENSVLRIPDRILEGYGPNTPGLLSMQKDQGCDLICCLDAGIVAFEPLAAAKAAGIEMIVIDHHNAAQDGRLPEGVAIINPNRLDDTSGLGHLCAAGVTFCFFVAVVRELRESKFFDGKDGRPAERPDLMRYLDLVALATVCDVMKLHGLNRCFVKYGTKELTARNNPGIAKLAELGGIDPSDPIDEKACGWILGPRINAGGRVGESDSGALLLLEKDPAEVLRRATALHEINVARKELSDQVTQLALEQLGDLVAGVDRRLAMAVIEDAHEGVVGISAGKVREAKDAPAIVVTRDHNGNLKGSARSIGDVNIGHIIQDAAASGLILGGGGHGAAGGLTLRDDQIEGFVAFANDEIRKTAYFAQGVKSPADVAVDLKDLSVEAINSLSVMRPFGNGNEQPRFLLNSVLLEEISVLKEKHLRLTMKHGMNRVTGLIWNVIGTPMGDRIADAVGSPIEVLGTADINVYMGRSSPQFMIEDIRFPSRPDPELVAQIDASQNAGLGAKADDIRALADISMDWVEKSQESGRMVLVSALRLDSIQTIKEKHLRISFADDSGNKLGGIKWNGVGTDFEGRAKSSVGSFVNVLGQIEINAYGARKSLQIKLKDIEPHQPEFSLDGIAPQGG